MGLESYQIFNLIITAIIAIAILAGVVVYFYYIHRVFSHLGVEISRAIEEISRMREQNSVEFTNLIETVKSSPLIDESRAELEIINAVRQGIYESKLGPHWGNPTPPPIEHPGGTRRKEGLQGNQLPTDPISAIAPKKDPLDF